MFYVNLSDKHQHQDKKKRKKTKKCIIRGIFLTAFWEKQNGLKNYSYLNFELIKRWNWENFTKFDTHNNSVWVGGAQIGVIFNERRTGAGEQKFGEKGKTIGCAIDLI